MYTEKELEILSVLWNREEASVQEVHDILNSGSGYTSTLKLMQLMYEKGFIDRRKVGKKHLYIALVNQEAARGSGIQKMVKKLFGGSNISFVQSFLGTAKPSKEELKSIKELIEKMEDND